MIKRFFCLFVCLLFFCSVVKADVISEINAQFDLKSLPVVLNELNGVSDSVDFNTNEYTKRISDYINLVNGTGFSVSSTSVVGYNYFLKELPNGVKDEIYEESDRWYYKQNIGVKNDVPQDTIIDYEDMPTGGQFVAYAADGTTQVGVKGDTLTIDAVTLNYQLAEPVIYPINPNEVYVRKIQLNRFNNMTTNYEIRNYDGSLFLNDSGLDAVGQSYVDDNCVYITVHNDETGFPHDMNYVITQEEIRAYLLGWRMCNQDGSVPYNGVGQKYWKAISNGQIVSVLPTSFAQNFFPINIRYEFQEPIVMVEVPVEPSSVITVMICIIALIGAIFVVNIVISVVRYFIVFCDFGKLPLFYLFKKVGR